MPPYLPTQSVSRCASCLLDAPGIDIAHDITGQRLTVCARCLRSSLRMKADLSVARTPFLLHDVAEDLGCNVWRGAAAFYLLPSAAPFADADGAQQSPPTWLSA